MLQQGGAGEVRRPRVGHAAGMGSGEGQQRLRAGGWLRRLPAADDKRQLGAAPRRLRTVGGDRKVLPNRLLQIDKAPVGQRFGPAGEQQVGLLKRAKVFAVDPQQIHRPAPATAGLRLALDAFHCVGGVGDGDNTQVDRVVAFDLLADPRQIAVDGRVPAPGVKPDGLPAGFRLDLPPAVVGINRQRPEQQQAQTEAEITQTAHRYSLFCGEEVGI